MSAVSWIKTHKAESFGIALVVVAGVIYVKNRFSGSSSIPAANTSNATIGTSTGGSSPGTTTSTGTSTPTNNNAGSNSAINADLQALTQAVDSLLSSGQLGSTTNNVTYNVTPMSSPSSTTTTKGNGALTSTTTASTTTTPSYSTPSYSTPTKNWVPQGNTVVPGLNPTTIPGWTSKPTNGKSIFPATSTPFKLPGYNFHAAPASHVQKAVSHPVQHKVVRTGPRTATVVGGGGRQIHG